MFHLRAAKLALSSLRIQLLFWIALPVAVSLLGFSLLEVRGHEQAMERMVQQQADLAARSFSALIDAHVDQSRSTLLQLADEWVASDTPTEAYISVFSGGLALYNRDGLPIDENQPPPWRTQPPVQTLVRRVLAQQNPSSATIQDADTGEWLLVQAAPMISSGTAAVIAGAVPVRELAAVDLLTTLSPDTATEMRVATGDGQTMLVLDQSTAGTPQTNNKVVTAHTYVAPTGWQVTVREEWTQLIPPFLKFANVVFVVLGLAVVISLLSAYFGLRNIVQPLRRLDAAAGEVGWGNFEAIQQPVGGVTEIEELRVALARMTEQIRLYQQELQSYIGAMTRGQEEERRRLARELHDETVQDLIALNQQVELVEREIRRDPDKAAERLQKLRPLLTDAMAGLRRQIHNLRPLYLEDLGFVPALEMLVRQVAQRHNLIGDFDVSGEPAHRLAPAVEISAFRIVQEALQNVVSHAHAQWVHVELSFEQDGIALRIEDNGRGFEVPAHPYRLAQQGHFGLLGMKERAQLHGGKLHIESTVGKGTTVLARLPTRDVAGQPHLK